MTIVLWLFGLGVSLELAVQCLPSAWHARKFLSVVALPIVGFSAGLLAVYRPNFFSLLIAGVSLARAFNSIRVVEGRMHEQYLHRATRRTLLVLLGYQAGIGGAWLVWEKGYTAGHSLWLLLAATQLAVAIMLLAATIRRIQHTAWPVKTTHYSDAELPTISVAIPARNETEDLQSCLQSLLASDYPKLEVLVLDDCSQTRRTPEIIRAFAHDGVRFIQGEVPKDTWLPKNQAYDTLAQEASGDYVLFCGVDIRFSTPALRQIMGMVMDRNKKMVSLLPLRGSEVRKHASLAQAMRYFWELVPPRRLFRRPPVLSSCWIIEKKALNEAGGFVAVSRSIVPEAYFARRLTAADGYSFMRAGHNPGVQSVKNTAEQRATAIRSRYPQLHRRPESVLLTTVAEIVFLLGPFITVAAGLVLHAGMLPIIGALIAVLLLTITYEIVAHATQISTGGFGLIALPLMVCYDLLIVYYSMWQYEFSEVDWKGRNICIPAMHVTSHLPDIK